MKRSTDFRRVRRPYLPPVPPVQSCLVAPSQDMPAHTASWIYGEPEAVANCTHVLPSDPNDAKNPFKAGSRFIVARCVLDSRM